jgi:F-type H+-transporting ATPase subunit delta
VSTAAARRYARAVFELAQESGEVSEWDGRLTRLRDLLLNEQVRAVLTNPTIATERRMALVAAEPHGLDAESSNLARLLIESNRVEDIAGVGDEYQRLADAAAGRMRATVTTAVELGSRERDKVAAELSERLAREVHLEVVVDPAILGGLKLQYGDRLVDASVATRLQQLRRRLAAN